MLKATAISVAITCGLVFFGFGVAHGEVWTMRIHTPDGLAEFPVADVDSITFTESPLDMILLPAGTFTMGDGVSYCGEDEHEVTLTHPFYLGRYEVTNQEYLDALQWAYDQGYVHADASSVTDDLDGSTEELLDLDGGYSEIQFDGAGTFFLADAGFGINGDHPVKEVSWYGAARFCDWLSLRAGLPRAYQHEGDWSCNGGDPYGAAGYRLPTDAEWEYAARFGDDRLYPWGNEPPECDRANYNPVAGPCVGWTTPVGSYPGGPAISGELLYDMAGNAREWCNDWHRCSLGTDPVTDPPGPIGGCRLIRGGSHASPGYDLTCARRRCGPALYTYSTLGFRCARSELGAAAPR